MRIIILLNLFFILCLGVCIYLLHNADIDFNVRISQMRENQAQIEQLKADLQSLKSSVDNINNVFFPPNI